MHARMLVAQNCGSPPISTIRLCEWMVITIKHNKQWKMYSFLKNELQKMMTSVSKGQTQSLVILALHSPEILLNPVVCARVTSESISHLTI